MDKVIIFDFDRTIGTLIIDWTEWRKDIRGLIYEFEPESDINLEDIRHTNQNDLIEKYGTKFRESLNQINEHSEQVLVTDFILNQKILGLIWTTSSKQTSTRYHHTLGLKSK